LNLHQPLQSEQDLLFFRLPFGGFPRPEIFRNPAVQLVHIGLIGPATYQGQALLQSFTLLSSKRFLAAFIAEQGPFELGEYVIGDVDAFQDLTGNTSLLLS
jgi:hypothetical protein